MKRIAIIGGGVSGLAIAWHLRDLDVEARIYEAAGRAGGKIQSEALQGGFLAEAGPNGYLNSEPATERLIASLDLVDALEPASARSDTRFVYGHGRLIPVPTKPLAFLTSPLLPLAGRLRVPLELFRGPGPEGEEETVRQFVRRRLGVHMADVMIDAMVSGIYAGDIDALSMKAAFPRLVEIEATYGGLLKGMRQITKARKAAGETHTAVTGQPRGRLTAFKGGMGALTTQLAARLEDQIELGRAAVKLARGAGGGYQVTLEGGAVVEADEVVLALPAPPLAALLEELAPAAAEALRAIPYASVVVLGLAFRREDVGHSLDGFGFLAPRHAGLRSLGVRFSSSTFSGRAPEGHVFFEALIGGAHDPEAVTLSDDDLRQIVLDELRGPLDLKADPLSVVIYRYTHAIPQYTLGHLERVAQVEAAVEPLEGLHLASNALYGIAMNLCLVRAEAVATRIKH
ncbi:protoporphyrinogen oxidase [Myxococcota bacterium]|nr:protoporphyrinogen oxidase [Myxococcota bacterium]MBU1429165.1 protoporphyrinogen oxidase [Myxococcota bacterium]MBU1896363.1 protoporphyrinogen oxidase [Myxococcota bacterium]